MDTLGERLRYLRQNRFGYTQQELAEKLGMGRANYSHIENNRVQPTHSDLQKLVDILQTNFDFLLGRSDDDSPIEKKDNPKQQKLYDVIARANDLEDEDIESVAETLEALINHHKAKRKKGI